MEMFIDPEELITCPYDKVHRIRKNKMQMHLKKCSIQHPDAKMVKCEFNACHVIPEPELQFHYHQCESRKNIEGPLFLEEGISIDKFPVNNIKVDNEEVWDDLDCASYNATEYCIQNNILRKLDTESAAKKKNFRIAERTRLKNLEKPSTNNNCDEAKLDKDKKIVTKEKPVLPSLPKFKPVKEETPEEITVLYERLETGAGKSFNKLTQKKS